MNANQQNYWDALEIRRRDLGVSYSALAERCGVSELSVKRVLHGKTNPTLQSLQSLAKVLGVEIRINGTVSVVPKSTAEQIRKEAAKAKAEKLVRLVQGTSALESQAVSSNAVRAMVSRTVRELLQGPNHKLWAP